MPFSLIPCAPTRKFPRALVLALLCLLPTLLMIRFAIALLGAVTRRFPERRRLLPADAEGCFARTRGEPSNSRGCGNGAWLCTRSPRKTVTRVAVNQGHDQMLGSACVLGNEQRPLDTRDTVSF